MIAEGAICTGLVRQSDGFETEPVGFETHPAAQARNNSKSLTIAGLRGITSDTTRVGARDAKRVVGRYRFIVGFIVGAMSRRLRSTFSAVAARGGTDGGEW